MSWNVYLFGRWIDRVWYYGDCNKEYVRESLINHDGYHPAIEVKLG